MTTARAEADEADLFDAEAAPLIRRLGERARGRAEPIDVDDAAVSAAVWRGLAGLGVLAGGAGAPSQDPGVPPGTESSGDGRGLLATARLHELMGNALYQSPYFDMALTADIIGADAPAGLLSGLAAGDVTIAVAALAHDADAPGPLEIDESAGEVSGVRRFVSYAAGVDHLLAVGTGAGGRLAVVLVPRDQPGVTLRRQDDLGRGDLYEVRFENASELPGGGVPAEGWAERWRVALARARLRRAGYLTGLALGALDLSADYARRRRVFGGPLAKLQAPAFRLASLAARVEAVRTLVHRTCAEADAVADIELPACQALMLAAELAVETAAEAIQIHGSYGLTERCDAQLFYRRAIVDSMLLGTGRDLRRRTAELLARTAEKGDQA